MLTRVASSLYWLSRNIERAETNARLLDVNMQLMLDFENYSEARAMQHWTPIISSLETNELFKKHFDSVDMTSVIEFVTFSPKNPNSIYMCIATARENARAVRDQMSTEMWEQVNGMYLMMRSGEARERWKSSASDFYRAIVDGSHLFQGITDATMTHGQGWDFMQIGKLAERADSTSRILDIKYHILLPSGETVGGTVDTVQWMAVLKACSAMEAFRKEYVGQVVPWKVAEFLVLHENFPRSIRFCVRQLDAALHQISGTSGAHFSNEAERICGRLRSELDFGTIQDIFQVGLHQNLDRYQARINEIGAALEASYCQSPLVDIEEQIRVLTAAAAQ